MKIATLRKCLCTDRYGKLILDPNDVRRLNRSQSCFDSPTDVNSNGKTALHIAARQDRHECIQFLLTRGARKEARDSDQKTPIQLALERKVYFYGDGTNSGCKSIKILVKAKADIDHLTRSEQTEVGRCMDDNSSSN